jgi:hypothetical protein
MMYQRGNETVRSVLNKAFFTKLYVDGRKVTEHELQEPFDLLSEAYRLYQDHRRHQKQAHHTYFRQRAPQTHRTAVPGRYGGSSLADSLVRALRARGSSKAVMVDLTCQHTNHTVLVEGPEISVRPVGSRRLGAGGSR